MLGGGSPREHTFANRTLVNVLTNDKEYFANPVDADRACTSMSVFVSSHLMWKNFDPPPPAIFKSRSPKKIVNLSFGGRRVLPDSRLSGRLCHTGKGWNVISCRG